MRTLQVELGERRYPIHIGAGLLARPELIAPYLVARRVAIVTNATVARLYSATVQAVAASHNPLEIVVPDGEQYKRLDVVAGIFDKLIEARCDRRTMVMALGGGVIGDMAGFAAACYQRGIPFIQLPTTLLAQVDSSVGGKTGLNHPLGKNMIGAFYQPQAVIIDTDTLHTLPDRQLRAGVAEVIKYGIIRDAEFFAWLEANLTRVLARDPNALAYAIERSCLNKADVVVRDERESGLRAILNFGHTFGHAIETATKYESWLHGEAIAAGMVMAVDLSHRLGLLNDDEARRINALIRAAGLPDRAPAGIDDQQLRDLMGADKKIENGELRLVLLKRIGEAVITADVPPATLAQTLAAHVHAA